MSRTALLEHALQDLGYEVVREDGALLVQSALEHPFRIEGNGSPHGLRLLSGFSVPGIPVNDRDAIASQLTDFTGMRFRYDGIEDFICSVEIDTGPDENAEPPLIALPPIRKASPKQDLSSY